LSASKIFLFAGALFALMFVHTASAQTISIVQGDGQLICDGCAGGTYSFLDDLIVLVSDANGNPLSGVTVTWSVTDADGIRPPAGTLNSATTTTSGANAGTGLCNQIGNSCNRYSGNDTGSINIRVMAVTAALSNGQKVTFTLTEAPNISASGSTEDNANALVTGPPNATLFEGTAGSTSSIPITVTTSTNGGQAIPNISVRLVPDAGTPAGSPTASCETQAGADPGSTLTNSNGNATCKVVFGPVPSTGNPPTPTYFRVLIGGVVFPQYGQNIQDAVGLGLGGPAGFSAPLNGRFQLIVTPATPNAVDIISGNSQSANPGQSIAAPLVVKVVDASSPPNPLAAVPVTWTVVPANAAVVTPASTVTGSNGEVSATVVLSNSAVGSVQVTASTANGKSVTFNLTAVVVVTVTSLAPVSSTNNQSAPVGTAFQPISVQVTTGTGQSLANVSVHFSVTSGSASLVGTNPALTSSSGMAGIGVTAGTTAGPVVVTATAGGQSVVFNLTVTPPGLNLTSAAFLNGAGFFPSDTAGNFSALSPCSIATVVVGTPLTPATLPATANLYGVAIQQPSAAIVTINGESAPILNITGLNTAQTLVTFQVPCDIAPGGYGASVTLNNASTLQPVSLPVRSASPGIFEIPMSDGVRRAVAVRPDGTFVSLANPARLGETIRIYITGIGPTQPLLDTNALPTPGVDSLSTAAFLAVQLNGSGVAVLPTSRVSPSLLGVFELDIQIPANAATGNNILLEVGVLVTSSGNYQFAQPAGSHLPIQ
jgi:uncharacterized protein (TIGR03437 family)